MSNTQKKKSSILWVTKKSSVLWVIVSKGSILWVTLQKFNSLSHNFEKKSCNSVSHIFEKKKSVLWVVSRVIDKVSILWVNFFRKNRVIFINKFNSLSRVHQKKKVQNFESCQKERFKSLSHIWKNSILWVVLEKKLNFLVHTSKKSSILWGILPKRVQFFESHFQKEFSSLSHIHQKVQFFDSFSKKSILWVICWKRVQIFASYKKLSGSILCVILKK